MFESLSSEVSFVGNKRPHNFVSLTSGNPNSSQQHFSFSFDCTAKWSNDMRRIVDSRFGDRALLPLFPVQLQSSRSFSV
jgi:hypothetical protein